MAIKQHSLFVPTVPDMEDKENVCPMQDFFYRRGNGVPQQKCRSPLPVGYPRAPLQDITDVISPIQVFRDSPLGCRVQPSRRIKRARCETKSSVSRKNSSRITQTPIVLVVVEDCDEANHASVSNTSKTENPVSNLSETKQDSVPKLSQLLESSDREKSLVPSFTETESSSMAISSEPERSIVSNSADTDHGSVLSSSEQLHTVSSERCSTTGNPPLLASISTRKIALKSIHTSVLKFR